MELLILITRLNFESTISGLRCCTGCDVWVGVGLAETLAEALGLGDGLGAAPVNSEPAGPKLPVPAAFTAATRTLYLVAAVNPLTVPERLVDGVCTNSVQVVEVRSLYSIT